VTDLVGDLGNKEHIRLSALEMKGLWFDEVFITHCQNWKNKRYFKICHDSGKGEKLI